VSKITAVGVFYIAWLGVLKSYGSACECGLFVCDFYCLSLFTPLLCDVLVLVTLVYGWDGQSGNVNGIGVFSPLFRCRRVT
jgi:hypothetical protein